MSGASGDPKPTDDVQNRIIAVIDAHFFNGVDACVCGPLNAEYTDSEDPDYERAWMEHLASLIVQELYCPEVVSDGG